MQKKSEILTGKRQLMQKNNGVAIVLLGLPLIQLSETCSSVFPTCSTLRRAFHFPIQLNMLNPIFYDTQEFHLIGICSERIPKQVNYLFD